MPNPPSLAEEARQEASIQRQMALCADTDFEKYERRRTAALLDRLAEAVERGAKENRILTKQRDAERDLRENAASWRAAGQKLAEARRVADSLDVAPPEGP